MVQFGYITLFASAFPLAGALALVCNALELGSDLFKLCFLCRRPPSERAANIGIWEPLLAFQVALSIFTNLFLFSFASDQMALLFPSLYAEEEPVTAAEGRGLLRAIADAAVGTAAQQHDHNDFEVKAGMEMDGYIDRQTGR